MSSTRITTTGRHVAPPTPENAALEYRAQVGRAPARTGRRVACAATAYSVDGAAHCTLAPGHLADDVAHAYGEPRPLAIVVDADTRQPLTGPLPISDARAIATAPTLVGRRVRVEDVA